MEEGGYCLARHIVVTDVIVSSTIESCCKLVGCLGQPAHMITNYCIALRTTKSGLAVYLTVPRASPARQLPAWRALQGPSAVKACSRASESTGSAKRRRWESWGAGA